MPEARDRLSRPDDSTATYSLRRITRNSGTSIGRGSLIPFVLEDEEQSSQSQTPFRWRGTGMVGTPRPAGVMALMTIRVGLGAAMPGRENLSPLMGSARGHGRGRGRVLPTWYPRRPLNDITSVVTAIERRRARQRSGEGLVDEGPILQEQTHSDLSTSISSAQPEHQDISMMSPHPTLLMKRCPPTMGKIPKILLNITNIRAEESQSLTPQKKLLNNIDSVEKVVMQELRKLKRTPSAKKAEREKRVRTLMSMR